MIHTEWCQDEVGNSVGDRDKINVGRSLKFCTKNQDETVGDRDKVKVGRSLTFCTKESRCKRGIVRYNRVTKITPKRNGCKDLKENSGGKLQERKTTGTYLKVEVTDK